MKTLLIIMAVFLTGCKDDEPENIVMEADVGLFYENENGMDLLNPDTDTIICTFRPDTYIDKSVYYNERLISDEKSDDRVPVTIVK